MFVSPYLSHVVKFPRTARDSRGIFAVRPLIEPPFLPSTEIFITSHSSHRHSHAGVSVPGKPSAWQPWLLLCSSASHVGRVEIRTFYPTDTRTNQLPFCHFVKFFNVNQNKIKNPISSSTYNASIHAAHHRFYFVQCILNVPFVIVFRVFTPMINNGLPFR